VFTARYALSSYMKEIRFFFKGLMFRGVWLVTAPMKLDAVCKEDAYLYMTLCQILHILKLYLIRSRWPCSLRRRPESARLLGLRVRIPLRLRMFLSCVCRVLPRQRLLRRTDRSFRGVQLSVFVCV
jgi:hypothetical protein